MSITSFMYSLIYSSLHYLAKDPVARKMRLRLRRQQSNQASAANKGEQDKQAAVLKVRMLGQWRCWYLSKAWQMAIFLFQQCLTNRHFCFLACMHTQCLTNGNLSNA